MKTWQHGKNMSEIKEREKEIWNMAKTYTDNYRMSKHKNDRRKEKKIRFCLVSL